MDFKTETKNNKSQTISFIIDVQRGFIDGNLAVKDASKIVPNIVKRLSSKDYKAHFLTADNHPYNHSSFVENGGMWPMHCVKHSVDAAIDDAILAATFSSNVLTKVLTKGELADKEEYSIFQNPCAKIYLTNILRLLDKDTLKIEIMGIAGDFCVLNTIKDLVELGYADNLVVVTDCIASIDDGTILKKYCSENNILMTD